MTVETSLLRKAPRAPLVELTQLDELWFQVGGTLCNLACNHCFISCRPGNDTFRFLSLDLVKEYLEESVELGVREYYFTGGEPFLNPEMLAILEATLALGPATVLTNGTAFTRKSIAELARLRDSTRYSLEIRVSIDGYDAATNDPIRGEGTFEKAMRGVELLAAAGFLPIVTVTETWPPHETPAALPRFAAALKARGYARPRIKFIPALRIGMEAERTRPYDETERVTAEMLDGYDTGRLLCSRARIVTDRGVAVCPILIEAPGAHLGARLRDALGPFPIGHGPCYTCYVHGAICSNPASAVES